MEIPQSRALEQTVNKGTTSDGILFLTGVQPYPASTKSLYNRPFPSCLLPLFQNESKCKTFHTKMSFYSQVHLNANQTHFHMKGFALGLGLKQRQKATRKWPICSVLIVNEQFDVLTSTL